MGKNNLTIEQLKLACKHVLEMRAAGITENFAIRTLELFADSYARVTTGGSVVPHHVDLVPIDQWSRAARKLKRENPNYVPRECLRVEHGTPRRTFAREVLKLHEANRLSERTMAELVHSRWKLAVITVDEDRLLNKIARSTAFDDPTERWRLAKIEFGEPEISD